MQVLVKASHVGNDVRCNICGQGFLVYWTRSSTEERKARRVEIMQALRDHHLATDDPAAHPKNAFTLPAWPGETRASAAAMLGGAPEWTV